MSETPTPEALAKAQAIMRGAFSSDDLTKQIALALTEQAQKLADKSAESFDWKCSAETLQAQLVAEREKVTEQARELANRQAEVDRLRSFVADLRRDSLHTDLVAKMAEQAREIERAWRQALWLRHGCPFPELYGDDGEMQCSRCLIDFKRQSIEEITSMWERRARAATQGGAGA